MKKLRVAAICAFAVIAIGNASAETASPTPMESKAGTTVFTRARLASLYQEAENKFYVRLKLLPRSKLPFTTQTFSVTDRLLLADIPERAWVEFTSRHVDGENVLTAIHVVPACVRIQPCD